MQRFSIVIATSFKRTRWLISRSLYSVYTQVGIDKRSWEVLIVDDNEDENEYDIIFYKVRRLRQKLGLAREEFPTLLLRNQLTRFASGSGAWNTGIFYTYERYPKGFISFLDDDDRYLKYHLRDCIDVAKNTTVAIFQQLIWRNDDKTFFFPCRITKSKLKPKNFFIGNPGVQTSNMFIKTQKLIEIGGFDESLASATDRDLMIRFLSQNSLREVEVVKRVGVVYYNHSGYRVTQDLVKKHQGLDSFYKKHKMHFSELAYKQSLERAKKLFRYAPKEQIVICMTLKNAEKSIENSVLSVLNQKDIQSQIILLIGNDGSCDRSVDIIKKIQKKHSNVILLDIDFGSVAKNRNFLNEYARENFPHCILIGRLDADDVIYSELTLARIEKIFREKSCDVLVCSNKQVREHKLIQRPNRARYRFLDTKYLLARLRRMARGDFKAELPSCNVFIKPYVKVTYPEKFSAEDHWFLVLLLMQKDKLRIHIEPHLFYCYYFLGGYQTKKSKELNLYYRSRKELYHFYLEYSRQVCITQKP
ncbi:MAG: glycosyltransferase [Bacteroidia bacterium]